MPLREQPKCYRQKARINPNSRYHNFCQLSTGERSPLSVNAFIEVIAPPPALIIIGAIHIAVALTALAKVLGYRVIVIDPRSAFASRARFPLADQIIVAHPEVALRDVPITPQTAVAVLGHDARLDVR